MRIDKKIIEILRKRKEGLSQAEIAKKISINRAVLLGYLRCMVDVGKIKSKYVGKSIVYYL